MEARGIRSLVLQLQAVVSHRMWVLGSNLGSSPRVLSVVTAEPSGHPSCHFEG